MGWPGVPDVDLEPIVEDGLDPLSRAAQRSRGRRLLRGFSNATLWPLYHDVIVKPEYRREWWNAYVEVNRVSPRPPRRPPRRAPPLVQDYQLQLVPKMLRMLRPDLTIGFFLHIPFPPVELFMQMPWRREIVEGLLGADLIGFHLPGGAQNFMFLARRLAGQQTSRALSVSAPSSASCRSDSAPSASAPSRSPSIRQARRAVAPQVDPRPRQADSQGLGNPKHIMLGVDRLDYTKGIDVRLDALYELLQEGRVDPADTVMVQLATPSRERVESYVQMRGAIEQTVSRINGEYAEVGDRWCTTSTAPSAGTN